MIAVRLVYLAIPLIHRAFAAPTQGGSAIHCRPSNATDTLPATSVFLLYGEYLNDYPQGIQNKEDTKEQNTIVKDGKLLVTDLPYTSSNPNATRVQFFECEAPPGYARPSEKMAPIKKEVSPIQMTAGQIGTVDRRSCLTVRNSTVSMENCASSSGDDFAAQWMHIYDGDVSHAGKGGSNLEAEVVLQGDVVAVMKDREGKNSYMHLKLSEFATQTRGNSSSSSSETAASLSTIMSVLCVVWAVFAQIF